MKKERGLKCGERCQVRGSNASGDHRKKSGNNDDKTSAKTLQTPDVIHQSRPAINFDFPENSKERKGIILSWRFNFGERR